jgi:hypothetical protein
MNYYYQKANGVGTNINMLLDHDQPNPWYFETASSPCNVAAGVTAGGANGNTNGWTYVAGTVPFTGAVSNQLMDPTDIATGIQMYHKFFGWDATTGMPTAATLTKLGLGYIQAKIPTLIVA